MVEGKKEKKFSVSYSNPQKERGKSRLLPAGVRGEVNRVRSNIQ